MGGPLVSQLGQTAQPPPSPPLGKGLPALPKKLLERIWAEEYVDFSELPPARVTLKNWRHNEGHTLLLQLQELKRPRSIIPDFTMWAQCFAVYMAALTMKHPQRLPNLMTYMMETAKNARKFKWPSWVIYDQNFRQEMAARRETNWARIEPGMYTQIFFEQQCSIDHWCRECHALDHTAEYCPLAPPTKHPKSAPTKSEEREVCRRYNDKDKHCNFKNCRYSHTCKSCKGRHPQFLCTNKQTTKESSSSK